MGCGSAKISQSSATHAASTGQESCSETDWGSRRSSSSQAAATAGGAAGCSASAAATCSSPGHCRGHHGHGSSCVGHRIISSQSQFSTVTAVSNTSRIRVTLSSDGSLLQIETENLSISGSSGEEAATSDDLMDMPDLDGTLDLSSSDEEVSRPSKRKSRGPRRTVHSAIVTSRQQAELEGVGNSNEGSGGALLNPSPDRSSSAFSDMPSSPSSQWNSVPTNSPHIELAQLVSVSNTPVNSQSHNHHNHHSDDIEYDDDPMVLVHRQDSCDSAINGGSSCVTPGGQSLKSPSASTNTVRPALNSAGGSLDRVLESTTEPFFRDPITSPCSEDERITNPRVFSDPSLTSPHVTSSRRGKTSRSFFGRSTVPRSTSTQSSIHRQSTLPGLSSSKQKTTGLPTSASLGSIAKLRQAFASAISSSKDKDDSRSPLGGLGARSKTRRGKLNHADTVVTLHSNGAQLNGNGVAPQMNGGPPPLLNGNASSSAIAKVMVSQVKSKSVSLATTPSTDPEDQGVFLGEQFSTIYNDIAETEANFLALHVHQDFFNEFEDLFDTDAPYLSCHQDNDLDL